MKHRTTPTLLAVVALLLALNLAAALPWPTAQAQDEVELWPPPPGVEPHIVAWEFNHVLKARNNSGTVPVSAILRQWSDGVIEVATWSAFIANASQDLCAANPFGQHQPCLSEWVVLQEFTP